MKLKRILVIVGLCIILLAVFIFLVNILIYLKSKPYIYKNIKDVPEAETVLIPGAAVLSSGQMSPIFQDRVNTAVLLYKTKKVSKFLVSGDNSTVSHNEVNPVRNYLLDKGIPEEDIFLDHAGFDTYSSMYRARDIFQVSSIIISTQSFHLSRAVFIARALGLKAYGVSADTGNIASKNYFREIFADEKAALDIVFHRTPKFLGSVIPITGKAGDYPNATESSDTGGDTTENGFITGRVTIGPNCPGPERQGEPCTTPPEAYTSREVLVYASDGVTVKTRVHLDVEGNYRISVSPGSYFIQISPAGIGPGEKKPAEVKPNESTIINFDIDTGIR